MSNLDVCIKAIDAVINAQRLRRSSKTNVEVDVAWLLRIRDLIHDAQAESPIRTKADAVWATAFASAYVAAERQGVLCDTYPGRDDAVQFITRIADDAAALVTELE